MVAEPEEHAPERESRPAGPEGGGALLRGLFLALIRLFYPHIAVSGAERVPETGPVIVVANHPNGLLDPVLLRAALRRPVAFLAKSTLFGNPLGRAAMRAFAAIPVYRAHEADTARNEETFDRCRALLARGGFLALFPEGTSHSDPRLKPLKTGAARIALSAAAQAAAGLGGRPPQLLPIGLLYEDKGTFRSRVTLVVGEPFSVGPVQEDERTAVAELTERIRLALADVVIEAESAFVQRALLAVAAWTQPDGGRDRPAVSSRARQMAIRWRVLVAEEPDTAEALAESFRRYMRLATTLGIQDPLTWEARSAPRIGRTLAGLGPLLLLAPLALLGAVMAWLPYRAVRPLAVRLAGEHTDLVGTLKLLLGLVVLTATYAAWTTLGGLLAGLPGALSAAALGPLTGFVALRFGERLERRREVLRAGWLRLNRERIAEALAERRAALTAQVEKALETSI